MVKVKPVLALTIAVIGVLVMTVAVFGQTTVPFISKEKPQEAEILESEAQSLRNPGENPTLIKGVYHDPLLGYLLKIPDGWSAIEAYPGVFHSPDEVGQVGYADQKGYAIAVNRHENADQLELETWMDREELTTYMVGETRVGTVAGYESLRYEADWGTVGHAVGSMILVGDTVYQADCYYPIASLSARKQCEQTLTSVLDTFQIDRK